MDDKTYLRALLNLRNNFSIKLITGFRGTGKFKLLQTFIESLKSEGIGDEQIVFINFEENDKITDFQQLYLHIEEKISNMPYAYLIFYEIHQVLGWEKAVNAFFLGFPVEIYIADSDEKILIEKLFHLLPDNLDVIRMLPLSFSAFIRSISLDIQTINFHTTDIDRLLDRYLKYGGLPIVCECFSDEKFFKRLLDGIMYEFLFKDIAVKYSVRNLRSFQSVLKFLAANMGKAVKTKTLEIYFKDNNEKITSFTIDNYLDLIDKSGIFVKISRYNIRNNVVLKSGHYFFCADSGLCSAILNFNFFNERAFMQNVVCLELLRRGYEVYSAQIGTMRADFFAISDKNKICIQILPTDGSVTLGKLLRPLHKLPNDIEKLLISKNPIKLKGEVKNITLTEFLLQNIH